MSWILFSILSAFVWAVSSVLDKYVFTKPVYPWAPVVLTATIGLFLSTAIFVVNGVEPLSLNDLAWVIASSFLLIAGNVFYFKAIRVDEISRIAALYYVSPLFIAVLSALFLGEVLNLPQYLGVVLTIAGALLVSRMRGPVFSLGPGVGLRIVSVLAFSGVSVITKHLTNVLDYWSVFSYMQAGFFLTLLPVIAWKREKLALTFKEHEKEIGLLAFSEFLVLAGSFFSIMAISLESVTLVRALQSISPFFVLLIVALVHVFKPNLLRELTDRHSLMWKVIALAVMLVGAVLVSGYV